MSSDLKVTNIKHESSSSNNLVLSDNGNVSITNTLSAGTIGSGVVFPTGKVIKTETSATISGSTSNSGDQTIASPTFDTTVANSKILILATLFAQSTSSSGNNFIYVKLTYSGTDIINAYPIVGSNGSTTVRGVAAFNLLHEPNVSAGTTLTYQVNINATYAGGTVYINNTTSPSKIIFMEIAP